MREEHVWFRCVIASATLALVVALAAPAAAQQVAGQRLDIGANVVASHSREFDANDVGVGGRFSWRVTPLLGVEAELTVFPNDFPSGHPFSQSRVEGLFGVTAGPTFGRLRPFARLRPGFLKMSEAPQPIACILIFPPPLSCTLASGRTMAAVDVGGGLEFSLTRAIVARVDAGDRAVRYPGQVFDTQFVAHDKPFFAHELRIAAGAGVRF